MGGPTIQPPGFRNLVVQGDHWVICKCAPTLHGRVAAPPGDHSSWIKVKQNVQFLAAALDTWEAPHPR